ncbi:MAG: hypothetical protein AAF985_07335, partial [Bacteroidota bacterium]
MKPFFLFLIISLCLVLPVESYSSAVKSMNDECATSLEAEDNPSYTDQELRERLRKLKSAISKPRLTPVVKSYIRTYTVKKRDRTEAMLGRTAIY